MHKDVIAARLNKVKKRLQQEKEQEERACRDCEVAEREGREQVVNKMEDIVGQIEAGAYRFAASPSFGSAIVRVPFTRRFVGDAQSYFHKGVWETLRSELPEGFELLDETSSPEEAVYRVEWKL